MSSKQSGSYAEVKAVILDTTGTDSRDTSPPVLGRTISMASIPISNSPAGSHYAFVMPSSVERVVVLEQFLLVLHVGAQNLGKAFFGHLLVRAWRPTWKLRKLSSVPDQECITAKGKKKNKSPV